MPMVCIHSSINHKYFECLTDLCSVAASAMFTYDYALTLQLEIDLLWTSDWNAVRVLYLIQRYTPFVDTVSLLLYRK